MLDLIDEHMLYFASCAACHVISARSLAAEDRVDGIQDGDRSSLTLSDPLEERLARIKPENHSFWQLVIHYQDLKVAASKFQ